MYESPIELMITDIQHQIVEQQDKQIYRAVVRFFPNIDKEELLRALMYDRDQYEKGYLDGKADAMASIVRCKDCKYYWLPQGFCTHDRHDHQTMAVWQEDDDFCSYGERREGE